ncbi:transposase [Bacillus sp. HMSC036E02]|nr:transposase [Bacillus sp. HMSC036E02]
MILSFQDELQLFVEELQRYVTPVFLEELAREIEFIKRKRKFSESDLATVCIWVGPQVASEPIVRLCSRLHAATGTLLSLEGLNKRSNAKEVLFLQHIFSLLLHQKVAEQTQMQCRQKDLTSKEHKKQITYKERSKRLVQLTFTLQIFLWNIYQKNKYTIFIPYDGKLNLSLKFGNHFFVFTILILQN